MMGVYKILRAGNQTLRQASKPVANFDRKTEKLIADLGETLKVQKDPVGVGLAAPQVGKLLRLFIIKSGGNISSFINPEIVWKSEETNDPSTHSARSGQAQTGKTANRKPITNNQESEKEYLMEGCLSLPHYYGPVRRAKAVRVTYQTTHNSPSQPNPQPTTHTKTFHGLLAQIIQHEIDHLNGILFIDRLLRQKRKLYEQKGKEWVEVELP